MCVQLRPGFCTNIPLTPITTTARDFLDAANTPRPFPATGDDIAQRPAVSDRLLSSPHLPP
jgi:hypothetical protein